jgi:hypothetical protein
MRITKPAALIMLLAGISWSAQATHAAAVGNAMSSNQAVTGIVAGSSANSYSFSVSNGKPFVLVLSESGAHDQKFLPKLSLTGPGDVAHESATPYQTIFAEGHPADGPWTAKVSRGDPENTSGGAYSLTLIQLPLSGATPLSGIPAAGSNDQARIDGWTFTGTAGHKIKLALATTGDPNFSPQLFIFTPSGALVSSGGAAGGETEFDITESGTWSIAVSKATDDGSTGSYTLSATDEN